MEMEMDGRPRTQSAVAQRLVLTATLWPGTRERALELAGSIAAHLETSGFEQLGVYLSEREVVFLIEARGKLARGRVTGRHTVCAIHASHEACGDSSHGQTRTSPQMQTLINTGRNGQ